MRQRRLEQAPGHARREPAAVKRERLAIGQPQPLDMDKPRASGQLQPSRDTGVAGFFTDPHHACLRDALRLDLFKEALKRSRRMLELDRPHTRAASPLARQQTVVGKAPHRLPDGLTRHPVSLHQLLIGGKTLVELAGTEPARQVGKHLRPQRHRARTIHRHLRAHASAGQERHAKSTYHNIRTNPMGVFTMIACTPAARGQPTVM